MARPMSRRRRRSKSMFNRAHMLPSSERAAPLMSEAVTTRRANRARRRRPARRQSVGWMLALGASALVHAGILVAFVAYGRSSEPVEAATAPARRAAGRRWRWRRSPLPVEVTDIEVTELPPVGRAAAARAPLGRAAGRARQPDRADPRARRRRRPRSPAPPRPTAGSPAARRPTTPFGSIARRCVRGSPTARPRRSRRGCGSRAAAPRPRPSAASRRSASAIRSGPSCRAARRSRRRTPPPIRRWAASRRARRSPRRPPRLSEAPPLVARVDPDPNAAHAVGPLDAEAGRRTFDVEQPGRAADDRTQRTASAELHPGITDFSRAAAPQPIALADGRGPSQSARRGVAPGGRHRARRARRPQSAGARSRGRRADARSALPAVHRGDPAAGPPDPGVSQIAGRPPPRGRDDRGVRGRRERAARRRPARHQVVRVRGIRRRGRAGRASRGAVSTDARSRARRAPCRCRCA